MDRLIKIARNPKPFTVGGWVNQSKTWREFASELAVPMEGSETFEEYLKAGKTEKLNIKCSAGGYVGGAVDSTGYRRRHHMVGRDVVTLDFDHLSKGEERTINTMCVMLGCDYVLHSSQSHTDASPRLRVIIPLSRTVKGSNEYAAVSRKLAFKIDPSMSKLDKTSHEYERLMFYPRHSKGAASIFMWHGQSRSDVPLCDVDALLDEYTDWTNPDEWPKAPENDYPIRTPDERKLKVDPESRVEPIGSFCRFFSMDDAIQMFLSDIYAPVDSSASENGRYTYLKGTSAAGAIVYDGKFLFSHHDTDPANGKTLNAFELVQLHKFGHLDEAANASREITDRWNERASFSAMCEWVQSSQDKNLMDYRMSVVKERGEKFSAFIGALLPTSAESDFAEVAGPSGENNGEIEWPEGSLNKDGSVKPTIANAQRIVGCDPLLKGRIKFEVFTQRISVYGKLPWHVGSLAAEQNEVDPDGWHVWNGEADLTGLRAYCEEKYGIPNSKKALIEDAVNFVAKSNQRNRVAEYIQSCEWDGVKRADTLFIDYLGAEDNPATREATHKALLGCVYRAFEPGHKFDSMCVLIGPQGAGKSTIIKKLAVRPSWFTDSIYSFDGKSLAESIMGCWIVEIGELHALRKAEIGQVRQVVASTDDRQRLSFEKPGEKPKPRRCIFFGTGNDPEVVRDPKGERRFWLIDTNRQKTTKSVWDDLTPEVVSQIWAEMYTCYLLGESDVLSDETYNAMLERQSDFRDDDPWEGTIKTFVMSKVPKDWNGWPMQKRLEFWDRFNADALGNTETGDYSALTGIDGKVVGELVDRDRISALEVWCELLSGGNAYTKDAAGIRLSKLDKKRINTALRAILPLENERCLSKVEGENVPGVWRYMSISNSCVGVEKGFKKIKDYKE